MAGKPRVHELAKELGVESKTVLAKLAEHGVNVNIVSPGLIDVGSRPGVSPAYIETLSKSIPWGRPGVPDGVDARLAQCRDGVEVDLELIR